MGITVAFLGQKEARKHFGKVGTQSDIHLHDLAEGGVEITSIVADRYPEKVQGISYSLTGCDAAVLVVDAVGPALGEQILAADAAGITHGVIVLVNYVQPDAIKPLVDGTSLQQWLVVEDDFAAARAHLAAAKPVHREGCTMVVIDHAFNVKGVGAVILGVVRRGTVRKSETLHAWPDRVICPVRSIQVHDVDKSEASQGDRVGLALRGTNPEQLDRGLVLAPADADLVAHKAGSKVRVELSRSRFARQELQVGSVIHLGFGMQFTPLRLDTAPPAAGQTAMVEGTIDKAIVVVAGERGIAWHLDAKQRLLGRVTI